MSFREIADWLARTTVERPQPRSRYARISAPDTDTTPGEVGVAAAVRLGILVVFVLWVTNATTTGFRVIFVVFALWWVALTVVQARTFLRDRAAIERRPGPGEPL